MTPSGEVELKEYLEAQLKAEREWLDERFDRVWDRFTADAEARRIAFSTMDRRLEGMNEIREQLGAQASTFLLRTTYDARHQALEDRIGKVENKQSNVDGRFWVLGVVFVIVQVALELFLRRGL